MIRLYTLFPDRLNLNGDQGNLTVLSKRLAWSNFDCEIIAINTVDQIENLVAELKANAANAFVFLGHGSMAAMKSIERFKGQIQELFALCVERDVPSMVVGSSYSWLVPHSKSNRRSEFTVSTFDFAGKTHEVIGYLNSADSLPVVTSNGKLIYTLLHGPVLLKSTTLSDAICTAICDGELGALDQNVAGYVAEATAVAKGERG